MNISIKLRYHINWTSYHTSEHTKSKPAMVGRKRQVAQNLQTRQEVVMEDMYHRASATPTQFSDDQIQQTDVMILLI